MNTHREPRWDLPPKNGHIGEMFGHNLAEDLEKAAIEIKTDYLYRKSGNIYVEYESVYQTDGLYHPSCINPKSESLSTMWLFVLPNRFGNVGVAIPTGILRQLCNPARIAEEKDGSNPTKGYLINLGFLFGTVLKDKTG